MYNDQIKQLRCYSLNTTLLQNLAFNMDVLLLTNICLICILINMLSMHSFNSQLLIIFINTLIGFTQFCKYFKTIIFTWKF